MAYDDMKTLVEGLAHRLGRLPTEDEVHTFIFGTKEQREEIWNGVVSTPPLSEK